MERIWLSEYPDGIPADINPHEYSSLRDILVQSCTTFGDLPAYTNMGVSLTYCDVEEKSGHFAAYLQTAAGLEKGDRLAIIGDSITEQKLYSKFIETYLLTCHPELEIQSFQ